MQIKSYSSFEELEKAVKAEEQAIEGQQQYQAYFATFGSSSPFAKNYVAILANNQNDARYVMFEVFGKKWAFIYNAYLELAKQVREYGLLPLCFLSACRYGKNATDIEIKRINEQEYLLMVEI